MAITAQYDMGLWPGATQVLEYAFDDHRIFYPFGALAWTQNGADELAGNAFKHEQWQVAIVAVVMIYRSSTLAAHGLDTQNDS